MVHDQHVERSGFCQGHSQDSANNAVLASNPILIS